jgi:hypothetical protein
MNIEQLLKQFRTPQGAVTALSTVVAILGALGIFSAPLTTALQYLLTAVLGVIVVVTHTAVSTSLVRRAARRTAPAGRLTTD